IGSPHLDHRMGAGRTDYAATRPAPGAIEALGKCDVVLLIGSDLTAEVPVLDLVLKRGLLKGQMKLITVNPRRVALDKFAHRSLRCAAGGDGPAPTAWPWLLPGVTGPAAPVRRRTGPEGSASGPGFGARSLRDLARGAGGES